MDQAKNSQKTPHTSPLRASYGMSFVSILMKNDRVIKGFYCINFSCYLMLHFLKEHNLFIPKESDIKNNAWVTVNNDFFVTSEAIRQWFSRVTKYSSRVKIIAESPHEWQKIVIHGNECIILFLTRYFMSWTHKSAIIERSFRHCCQGRPFLTEHCDVTTIDLWRHANAKYWYCDVIFVYCHCTRKLAQRRSSLVNNSREYRYLATRYSRLSV